MSEQESEVLTMPELPVFGGESRGKSGGFAVVAQRCDGKILQFITPDQLRGMMLERIWLFGEPENARDEELWNAAAVHADLMPSENVVRIATSGDKGAPPTVDTSSLSLFPRPWRVERFAAQPHLIERSSAVVYAANGCRVCALRGKFAIALATVIAQAANALGDKHKHL